jgi:F0F1-type ATP synthase assembly protein I
MSQPEKPKGFTPSPIINLGVALASQIAIIVIGLVLVAVVIGLWLDRTLNTKPIFTILLIVGSGPVSLYLVFRLATNAVSKLSSPGTATAEGEKEGGEEE